MREFSPPVSPELRARLLQLSEELLAAAPERKPILGGDLAMEEAELVIGERAKLEFPDGATLEVALSRPEGRPPIEWLAEITSTIDEGDYFKHYLVRDDDLVMAHRKTIIDIDDEEARMVENELLMGLRAISEGGLKVKRRRGRPKAA